MRDTVGPLVKALGSTASVVAFFITLCNAAAQPIDRKERLIIELTKPIEDTVNSNWFIRQPDKKADRREFGAHQVMWEPLFLLHYDTGQLDPWLG